ncbi:MAG: translation initiation factor eIF4A [Paramarteilia canceri]
MVGAYGNAEQDSQVKSAEGVVDSLKNMNVVTDENINNIEENNYEEEHLEVNQFEKMGISVNILKGIYAMQIETPSPVQKKAIIPLLNGKDVLVQSQSGTGKTLAFAIGSSMSVDPQIKQPQVLIFAHTRELCSQIHKEFEKLLKFEPSINVCVLLGERKKDGTVDRKYDMVNDKQIIVGTTGKIANHLKHGKINPNHIKQVIFDEADKMLDQNFLPEVNSIINALPQNKSLQICFFSATVPPKIEEIMKTVMREDRFELLLKEDEVALKGIKQYYHPCLEDSPGYKLDVLISLCEEMKIDFIVCFCNTKEEVKEVGDGFARIEIPFQVMHGDLEQDQREEILQRFRSGELKCLICTDLLGRGIDVQQISLVINYSLPYRREEYIHRVGRSGRYGRKGVAINFVNTTEQKRLQDFELTYHFKCLLLPEDISNLLD